MKSLENDFHDQMIKIYKKAKSECKYTASRFLQMVNENGGLATAKYLIREKKVSDGFTALWERKRLDLTVEALSLNEPWRQLFTEEELDIARKRLGEYGYGKGEL